MSGLFNVAKISGIEAIEEVVAGSQLEPTQLAAGQLTGFMAQLVVGRKSLSTAEISGSFRAYGPLSESNCTLGAIIDSSASNSQWDYETQLETVLKRGRDAGVFDVADTKLATMALIAMLTGVTTWYRDDGRLSRERVERIYWNMVRRAVGA